MIAALRTHLVTKPLSAWLLALSGWVAVAVMVLPVADVVRVVTVFPFILIVPGLALSGLIRLDTLERAIAALALSFSVALLVTTLATVARNDSMVLRVAILAGITTAAALANGQSHRPVGIADRRATQGR